MNDAGRAGDVTDTPLAPMDEGPFDLTLWQLSVRFLVRYWRLYMLTAGAGVAIGLIYCAMATPIYTAKAVIGPPGPSPINVMIANSGGVTATGAARRMLAGAGALASNDPYQEYVELLKSSRLYRALIDRHNLTRIVFKNRWDAKKHAWEPRSTFWRLTYPIKAFFHVPASSEPGVDELAKYLAANFAVEKSTTGNSPLMASAYSQVSLRYADRAEAERILGYVLLEADNLIRDDQRRDVAARVKYLRDTLEHSPLAADERTALIYLLSDQEQIMAMIEADHRFASTLVVPPYAAVRPTSPSISKVILGSILVSMIIGTFVGFAESRNSTVGRLVRYLV